MEAIKKVEPGFAVKHGTHEIPNWLGRVLSNQSTPNSPLGELEKNPDQITSTVACWNLETARQLIRIGIWAPTSENLVQLRELSRKYYPRLGQCSEFS